MSKREERGAGVGMLMLKGRDYGKGKDGIGKVEVWEDKEP